MKLTAPPFRLSSRVNEIVFAQPAVEAQPATVEDEASPAAGRRRLVEFDAHLHCSVIGTCIGTAELRTLVSRHLDVADADDLEVHHEAVRQVSDGGALAKSLQKALDRKHDAAIRRASRVRGADALLSLWKEALHHGDIPGMYWAVLMHRDAGFDVIKQVFGDVHMLSHLVGSSNRADIRRLGGLESENADLRKKLDAIERRSRDAAAAHAAETAGLHAQLAEARLERIAPMAVAIDGDAATASAEAALQSDRRERWERAAIAAQDEVRELRAALEESRRQVAALEVETAVLASHLDADGDDSADAIAAQVRGRRILYVGGRPGSTGAIRDLVVRHGGSFRSHDGGLEDRKGLLGPAVASSDVVLFPVDCIDHDSAGNIKKLCARSGVPYVPLRSAGVASFAAALARPLPA